MKHPSKSVKPGTKTEKTKKAVLLLSFLAMAVFVICVVYGADKDNYA